MVKGLRDAYYYQLLWQLPNLLIIPLLVRFVDPINIVGIVKLFIMVALVFMISDWGHSTLGAQELAEKRHSIEQLRKVFIKGETIRFLNAIIVLFILYFIFIFELVVEWGNENQKFYNLIGIAAAVQLIFPNWAVVGLEYYAKINRTLLIMRVLTLSVLYGTVAVGMPSYNALLVYYLLSLMLTLMLRFKVTSGSGLNYVLFKFEILFKLKISDFKAGLIYVVGGILSYLTLNSGVFVADCFLGKAFAASYAIAERLLAIVRALYLPFVQFTIVKIKTKANAEIDESKVNLNIHMSKFRLMVSVIYAALVLIAGELYFHFIYINEDALMSFRVLIVGFSFLGASHHYITFLMLGRGYYKLWILGLCVSLLSYVAAIASMVGANLQSILIVSLAIVFAEIVLFFYGFLSSILFPRSVFK